MIKTHKSPNLAMFTVRVCMKSHYLSKQAVALVHPPPVGLAFSIECAHHATGLREAQWEQAEELVDTGQRCRVDRKKKMPQPKIRELCFIWWEFLGLQAHRQHLY